jgi:hypothetical protein
MLLIRRSISADSNKNLFHCVPQTTHEELLSLKKQSPLWEAGDVLAVCLSSVPRDNFSIIRPIKNNTTLIKVCCKPTEGPDGSYLMLVKCDLLLWIKFCSIVQASEELRRIIFEEFMAQARKELSLAERANILPRAVIVFEVSSDEFLWENRWKCLRYNSSSFVATLLSHYTKLILTFSEMPGANLLKSGILRRAR